MCWNLGERPTRRTSSGRAADEQRARAGGGGRTGRGRVTASNCTSRAHGGREGAKSRGCGELHSARRWCVGDPRAEERETVGGRQGKRGLAEAWAHARASANRLSGGDQIDESSDDATNTPAQYQSGRKARKTKTYSIEPSHPLPDDSTTSTRPSLTSLFGWEAVTLGDVAACEGQAHRQSISPFGSIDQHARAVRGVGATPRTMHVEVVLRVPSLLSGASLSLPPPLGAART